VNGADTKRWQCFDVRAGDAVDFAVDDSELLHGSQLYGVVTLLQRQQGVEAWVDGAGVALLDAGQVGGGEPGDLHEAAAVVKVVADARVDVADDADQAPPRMNQHGIGTRLPWTRGTGVGRWPTTSSNRHVPLRGDGACRP
jgi:hypothetical protein